MAPFEGHSYKAAYFAAFIIATVIYGIILQQTGRYNAKFKSDSVTLKLWAYILFFLATISFGLDSYNIWCFLMPARKPTSMSVAALFADFLEGTIIFLVQIFFIVRIWKICAVLILLALSAVACWFVVITCFIEIEAMLPEVSYTATMITMGNLLRYKIGADAVVDAVITVLLVSILHPNRHEFIHLWKHNPLEYLLVFFATRGLIILGVQSILFVLALTIEPAEAGVVATILMPKVYTISMLLTLTNRVRRSSASRRPLPPHSFESFNAIALPRAPCYSNYIEAGLTRESRSGWTSPVVLIGGPFALTEPMELDHELEDIGPIDGGSRSAT